MLAGTIALFVALLAAMIVTRNIDWYIASAETKAAGTRRPVRPLTLPPLLVPLAGEGWGERVEL